MSVAMLPPKAYGALRVRVDGQPAVERRMRVAQSNEVHQPAHNGTSERIADLVAV